MSTQAVGSAIEFPAIGHKLTIACISAATLLAVFAISHSMPHVYCAVSILLLYNRYPKLAAGNAVFTIGCSVLLSLGIGLVPRTIDAALYALDIRLGSNPLLWILTVQSSSLIHWPAKVAYDGFLIVLTLTCLASRNPERFYLKIITAAALGFMIYFAFPACGPRYYLTGQLATAPRNAMPSLHFTWAILQWIENRAQSLPVRVASDAFLIFTLLATLGSGEHYVVDLLAAVPFALLIHRCLK